MSDGTVHALVPLSPLDVAVNEVFGWIEPRSDHPLGAVGPRAAFEAALLPALERSPCVVLFSGGRDSSFVLAAAVDVARRHGLALPVAYTQRFADAPESDERYWQELVVEHLRLPDWEIVDATGRFDLLAPPAQRLLRRYGLLYPGGVQGVAEALAAGAGGAVLTGEGGDCFFDAWRWEALGDHRAARPAGGGAGPRPGRLRLAADAALARSPGALRRRVHRFFVPPVPWLTPEANEAYRAAVADDLAAEPDRWSGFLWREAGRFGNLWQLAAMALLAADVGTTLYHPFHDRGFLAAAARHWDPHGPGRRTLAMRELAGDVLPAAVVERADKADFTGAVFGAHTRTFLAGFTGAGIDERWVDVDALVAAWAEDEPDSGTFLLVQQAWLAAAGGQSEPEPAAVDGARLVAMGAGGPRIDLVRALDPAARPAPNPAPTGGASWRRFGIGLRRLARVGRADLAAVARAGASLSVIEVGLRTMPLDRLCRRLGVGFDPQGATAAAGADASGRPLSPQEARRAWAAEAVLAHWPYRDTCLRRALLQGLLFRRLEPRLVLGVRRDGDAVRAHAWLEGTGTVLDSDGGREGGYQPLQRSTVAAP